MAKTASNTINTDEIFELLRVRTWDDVSENWDSETYGAVYREAIRDGETEEKAEKAAMKAEQEEQDDRYREYHDCVERVAEELFAEHRLKLTPKHSGERTPYEYEIEPKKDWKDAALAIMNTINGVGMFEINSLKEFLEYGPYRSAKEAVFEHLGQIRHWPEVYGGGSPQQMVERCLR